MRKPSWLRGCRFPVRAAETLTLSSLLLLALFPFPLPLSLTHFSACSAKPIVVAARSECVRGVRSELKAAGVVLYARAASFIAWSFSSFLCTACVPWQTSSTCAILVPAAVRAPRPICPLILTGAHPSTAPLTWFHPRRPSPWPLPRRQSTLRHRSPRPPSPTPRGVVQRVSNNRGLSCPAPSRASSNLA